MADQEAILHKHEGCKSLMKRHSPKRASASTAGAAWEVPPLAPLSSVSLIGRNFSIGRVHSHSICSLPYMADRAEWS